MIDARAQAREMQDQCCNQKSSRRQHPTFAEMLQKKIDSANREIKRLQRVRNAAHKFLIKLESDPELVQIIHEDFEAAEGCPDDC